MDKQTTRLRISGKEFTTTVDNLLNSGEKEMSKKNDEKFSTFPHHIITINSIF